MDYRLNHIAITTRDLRTCRAFWETVFGAKEIDRPSQGVSSDGIWLKVGDIELHLLSRMKPINKTDQHFALVVEDADAIIDRARRMGRQFESREVIPGFSKRYYLYDPDDNRVEILEK